MLIQSMTGSSAAMAGGFSQLDSDGDGKLNLAELTSELTRYTQSALSSFASDSALRSSALSA